MAWQVAFEAPWPADAELESQLVELWSEKPCLVEVTSAEYSDRNIKQQAIEEMAAIIGKTVCNHLPINTTPRQISLNMADTRKKSHAIKDLKETLNLKAARIRLQQRKWPQSTEQDNEIEQEEKARHHYVRRLLSAAFNGWRRASWSNEWTLTVRANYHYKYHLFIKVWKAWQVYVVRQRVKRAKMSVAVMQADYASLRRYFSGWRVYVRDCRLKRVKLEEADDLRQRALLRRYFISWRCRLDQVGRDNRAEALASQHRSSYLTQKFFSRWRQYVMHRRVKKRMKDKADCFYSKILLRKCLYQGFLPYTLHRRDRLKAKAAANEVYMDHLVHKSFHRWHRHLVVRRHITEKQEQIQAMGQRSQMRRILNHWKYYVKLCYDDRQNLRIAVLHHNRSLMRMSFTALHLRLVNKRLKILQHEEACSFNRKQMLKDAWCQWTGRIEEREEQRIYLETKRARQSYNHVILRKAFVGWREYHRWRQTRQNDYRMAEAHHVQRVYHRALVTLRENVSWQNMKREDDVIWKRFYREHTLAAAFITWKESYHLCLDVRMMERMAILHNQRMSLKKAFKHWKYRTHDLLSEQENMVAAARHLNLHVCQRYFTKWRQFVKDSKESHTRERLAERHRCRVIQLKVFVNWRNYTDQRRAKLSLRKKADDYYGMKLLRLTLKHWKLYHADWKKRLCAVDDQYTRHSEDCVRSAFQTWMTNARAQAEGRRLEDIATTHWKTCLVRRLITVWHTYTLEHAVKSSRQMEQLRWAVQQLNKSKLKQCFVTWKALQKESATERVQSCLAKDHYAKNALRGALVRWKEFRKLQTKKMLLEQQCSWLSSTRLQAKHFLQWRRQYCHAVMEQSQTNIALWHWSLVLQGKVLVSWHRYMLERRKKKARYDAAMESRHRRLLETGLYNWLKTSDELSERRAKSLAENRSRGASRKFHLVRRYALLWQQKTLANRVKEERRHPVWTLKETWVDDAMSQVPCSSTRRRPKRPNFLRDSLKTAGLWDSTDGTIVNDRPDETTSTVVDQCSAKDSSVPSKQTTNRVGSLGEIEDLTPSGDVGIGINTKEQMPALKKLQMIPPPSSLECSDGSTKEGTSATDLETISKPKTALLSSSRAHPTNGPYGRANGEKSHIRTQETFRKTNKTLLPPSAFSGKPSELPNPHGLLRPLAIQGLESVPPGKEMGAGNRVGFSRTENGVGCNDATAVRITGNYGQDAANVLVDTSSMLKDRRHEGNIGSPTGIPRDGDISNFTVTDSSSRAKTPANILTDELCQSNATICPRDLSQHIDNHTGSSNHMERLADHSVNGSIYVNDAYTVDSSDSSGHDGDTSDVSGSMGPDTLADKVSQLKTLLLEYQQLKQQKSVLEDQKQVLMVTLDGSEETSFREEYKLVTADIDKHSEALQSMKEQITGLMKETGL